MRHTAEPVFTDVFWAAGALCEDDKMDMLRKTKEMLEEDAAAQCGSFMGMLKDAVSGSGHATAGDIAQMLVNLKDGLALSFMANFARRLGYTSSEAIDMLARDLGFSQDVLDKFNIVVQRRETRRGDDNEEGAMDGI